MRVKVLCGGSDDENAPEREPRPRRAPPPQGTRGYTVHQRGLALLLDPASPTEFRFFVESFKWSGPPSEDLRMSVCEREDCGQGRAKSLVWWSVPEDLKMLVSRRSHRIGVCNILASRHWICPEIRTNPPILICYLWQVLTITTTLDF